jgi:transcription elongation factor Elf1
MKYLKSDSYYSDLYDKFTVDECRRMERHFLDIDTSKGEFKKYSKKTGEKCKYLVHQIGMYAIKGERYSSKETTIRRWKEEDTRKDLKLEDAQPPQNISCLKCGDEMECTFKDLWEREKEEKVLFFFECSRCSLRRVFFEDGKEYRSKRKTCEKCGGELEVNTKRSGEIFTTKFKCLDCGAEKVEEFDSSIKKEPVDKNFIKDRDRFCMTDKEGLEYITHRDDMKRFQEHLKETKAEEKEKIKKKKVKQLKIFEAQKIVIKSIEKDDYSDMKFGEPEIKKDVIVEFTAYDKKAKREEYDSRMQLKKIIEKSLKDTNWKLMSDGISCKLGILRGRLRGEE